MNKRPIPDPGYFELHARVCHTISHARRLQILYALEDRELSVSQLEQEVGFAGSSLSQHLAILKHQDIITSRREGRQIYYRIGHPRVMEALHLISEVVMAVHRDQMDIIQQGKKRITTPARGRKRPSTR